MGKLNLNANVTHLILLGGAAILAVYIISNLPAWGKGLSESVENIKKEVVEKVIKPTGEGLTGVTQKDIARHYNPASKEIKMFEYETTLTGVQEREKAANLAAIRTFQEKYSQPQTNLINLIPIIGSGKAIGEAWVLTQAREKVISGMTDEQRKHLENLEWIKRKRLTAKDNPILAFGKFVFPPLTVPDMLLGNMPNPDMCKKEKYNKIYAREWNR